MRILRRPSWQLPERQATPESLYLGRRDFMRALGAGAAATVLFGCARPAPAAPRGRDLIGGYKRNPKYTLDRALSDEKIAATYNNYYEFTSDKEGVAEAASKFVARPWTLTVGGLCKKPRTWDLDAIVKAAPLEERLYRHRCVEAWAMAVPWIGLPFAAFLKLHEPLSAAKYVRFVSLLAPDRMIGQKTQPWYPWPYFEGLTMAEAMSELTLLTTGIYGHDLLAQHGAPLRLTVPWKYGYKSPKAIVKIELIDKQPPTFWNQLAPDEYGFESNVNPQKPHPRWSQASERMIGSGERRPTLPYNGYGEFVASLYR
jgi:sulfoxide reductase catalytic subunit YedY